jgi:hypothetical protein
MTDSAHITNPRGDPPWRFLNAQEDITMTIESTSSVSRRNMLRGAAALPVVAAATPLAASTAAAVIATDQPDPILAAIETHRAALANHLAAVEREWDIEEKRSRDEQLYEIPYREAECATAEASDAADSIAMTLLDINPTTVVGAALLDYVSAAEPTTFPDFDDDDNRISFEMEIMRRVGKALNAARRVSS